MISPSCVPPEWCRHRCITFARPGFPWWSVPPDRCSSPHARAGADMRCVLDGLGSDRALIVGLSMGGFATLHFGLTWPERALSLLIAGCGYGSERDQRDRFRGEADIIAERLRRDGMAKFAETYALGPTRVQFQNKDPRGWREFADQLARHSAEGSANTQQGVQKGRPSVFDLEDGMRKLTVPTLIVTGDEDWPCLHRRRARGPGWNWEVRRTLGPGPDPRAVPEQGPARLAGVRRPARPALRRRLGQYPAGRAEGAAVGLRPGGRHAEAHRAHPDRHRRRGLAVPHPQRLHEIGRAHV